MVWTEEMIRELLNLRHDGASTPDIAAKLNLSRNAVLGKLHRMGLLCTAEEVREKRSKGQLNRAAGAHDAGGKPMVSTRSKTNGFAWDLPPPDQITDLPKESAPHGIPLLKSEPRHCRWPIGEPREPDFLFCGGLIVFGSYCARHSRMAYRRWEARA